MTGPRIAILGSGVEAWLFAALFRQLSRRAGTLLVIPTPNERGPATIALPPVVASAHALLRIAPPVLAAFGRPRYGIRIAGADGTEALIPYGSFGDPDAPGTLADAWIRLRSEDGAPPLASLSINRALMAGGQLRPDSDPRLLRSIGAGWEIDTDRYTALLKEAALSRGAECSAIAPDAVESDLVIDAREDRRPASAGETGWHGRTLSIGSAARSWDTAEPFAIAAVLAAAARLATLLPRRDAMPLLAREYNRLLAIELAGMETASALLARLAGRDAPCGTLDRYEARYRAAGLLPADPQPWTQDIWLSAFDALGWRPQRYDPNIDRFDGDRSTRRFDGWKALIDRHIADHA
jgi:hypothetical protein